MPLLLCEKLLVNFRQELTAELSETAARQQQGITCVIRSVSGQLTLMAPDRPNNGQVPFIFPAHIYKFMISTHTHIFSRNSCSIRVTCYICTNVRTRRTMLHNLMHRTPLQVTWSNDGGGGQLLKMCYIFSHN